jgi:hypothetical protein
MIRFANSTLVHKLLGAFISVIGLAVLVYLMGLIRAHAFGFSGRVLVAEVVVGLLFGLLGYWWSRLATPNINRPVRIVIIASIILGSCLITEMWFWREETCFKSESQGLTSLDRPRKSPYQSFGLLYEHGSYSAHD